MELLIQKEGQLDLTKVFKNGYFTKLDTYLLELKSVPTFGQLFARFVKFIAQLRKSYNNNC